MKLHYKAFTLVEVLVSITIFSIMTISIIWIYVISTDITLKSDINRMMQENIKTSIETIAEDIRKNWVFWVWNDIPDNDCDTWWENYWVFKRWNKLCTKDNSYYLAYFDETINDWSRTTTDNCDDIKSHCRIYKKWSDWKDWPITNSFVSLKYLDFYYSNDYWVSKVTINLTMRPSIGKWIKPNLIIDNTINFQTTISNRPF